MTLPRCAADVLADHVLFEIEAIDRMYLNLYQPRLQHGAGIAAFFVGHRGYRFASSALMAPMTTAFTANISHFIAARGLGLVPAQVLYAGVAQEKQKVFRTSKRRNPVTGATYPWLVPSTAVVNQYYFYCVDEEFGPVCVKFSSYFPYTGRLILDNLDLGRPDRVSLIFDRKIIRKGKRATPGRFRTRVITEGVTPSLHVDYKNSKIKQYHKLGKALRTETTINDTRDFGVAKGLSHLPELKEIGFTASRRLLDVQRISHDPADGAAALAALTQPVISQI